MNKKRLMSLLVGVFGVVTLFTSGMNITVQASDVHSESKLPFSSAKTLDPNSQTVEITEPTLLKEYANELGYELKLDDGYTLDSIEIGYTPSEIDEQIPETSTYALGDSIGNVKAVGPDYYFPNSPIASNWYQGPLSSITKTYSRTFSGTYSASVGIDVDMLSSEVGFEISDQMTESTTLVRPGISSNQKINIKEFGVYYKYSFSVYNLFGFEKGTGNAYKPMGLYVTQATYSK